MVYLFSLGMEYGATKKGWFNEKTFLQWLNKVFVKHTKHLPRPVVLIGDNSGCHFTQKVLDVCRAERIKLIPLVPNATHIIQPLDVAVFRPLKTTWFKVCKSVVYLFTSFLFALVISKYYRLFFFVKNSQGQMKDYS